MCRDSSSSTITNRDSKALTLVNLGPGHPSVNEAKVILKNQNIITGQSDFDVKGKKSFFNLSPTQGQT